MIKTQQTEREAAAMGIIYILEDDANIREIETYALKNSGYEVASFERASEFYDAASRRVIPAESFNCCVIRKTVHVRFLL